MVGFDVEAAIGRGASAGHARHVATVAISDKIASAAHVSARPMRISAGTNVPLAVMPSPTPVKMMPPARPRRAGGTPGKMCDAANTINAPPAAPAMNRHTKYHENAKGKMHPANEIAALSIINCNVRRLPNAFAMARAVIAPAR